MTAASILIVEDDPALVRGLADNFASQGYDVRTAMAGNAGLASALAEPAAASITYVPGVSSGETKVPSSST